MVQTDQCHRLLCRVSSPGAAIRRANSHGSCLSADKISVQRVSRHSFRPRGHAWLVNVNEQKVVEFKPEDPTADGQWVTLRTFHWRPPDYPIPESRRRMMKHEAIDVWEKMLSAGWRQCSPPVR
ncbi:DUF1651 domain-containing protein [Synechococcus sp. A15-28]|uniref:DUF1651 domain-containing protein n=1 Tax=Synechococcus sp. A15-28 TaxID=1050638 RepID=UPI00336A2CAE